MEIYKSMAAWYTWTLTYCQWVTGTKKVNNWGNNKKKKKQKASWGREGSQQPWPSFHKAVAGRPSENTTAPNALGLVQSSGSAHLLQNVPTDIFCPSSVVLSNVSCYLLEWPATLDLFYTKEIKFLEYFFPPKQCFPRKNFHFSIRNHHVV